MSPSTSKPVLVIGGKVFWQSVNTYTVPTSGRHCSDVNVDLTTYTKLNSVWFHIVYVDRSNQATSWRGGALISQKDNFRVVFSDIPSGQRFRILASSPSTVFNVGV